MTEFDSNPQAAMQDAATAGAEMLFRTSGDAVEVAKYVQGKATHLAPEEQHKFVLDTYLAVATGTLWDETVDPLQTMRLLNYFNFEVEYADALAQIGSDLARDERFVDRGHSVLRHVGMMYRGAYAINTRHGSDSPIERVLFLAGNYFNLIDLQTEAGDAQGAEETTLVIVPDLVELADEIDETEDNDIRAIVDAMLSSAVTRLGNLGDDQVQDLFRRIKDERVRTATTHSLIERLSRNLLAVGQVNDALTVLIAEGIEPHGLWSEATALLAAGERDAVQAFVQKVDQRLPGYYSGWDEQLVKNTPVLEVLAETEQDNFLEEIFRSLLMEGAETALWPIQRFAYRCGLADNITRLQSMTDTLALNKEQKNTVYDSFQEGIDASSAQT